MEAACVACNFIGCDWKSEYAANEDVASMQAVGLCKELQRIAAVRLKMGCAEAQGWEKEHEEEHHG